MTQKRHLTWLNHLTCLLKKEKRRRRQPARFKRPRPDLDGSLFYEDRIGKSLVRASALRLLERR